LYWYIVLREDPHQVLVTFDENNGDKPTAMTLGVAANSSLGIGSSAGFKE
jgi:hypothetical protein